MPDSLANRSADGLLGCAVGQGFRGGLFWAVNDPAHPLRDAYQALHLRVAKDNSFESLVAWLHRLPTGNAEPTLPPPHESATARAAAEKTGIQAAFFAVAIALATALCALLLCRAPPPAAKRKRSGRRTRRQQLQDADAPSKLLTDESVSTPGPSQPNSAGAPHTTVELGSSDA